MQASGRRNWTSPVLAPKCERPKHTPKMLGASIFSGIGGFEVALAPYVQTKLYVEQAAAQMNPCPPSSLSSPRPHQRELPLSVCEDADCIVVLKKLMACGCIPKGRIVRDVRDVTAEDLAGINMLFGGFPCPDICGAGQRQGFAGERSVLFAEMVKAFLKGTANHIMVENVGAILHNGMETVIRSTIELIVEAGYTDCKWCVVCASHVGSPQCRARWFLLASKPDTAQELRALVPLLTTAEAQEIAARPWNPGARLPMEDWLQEERGATDLPRLQQMGNCVVPAQAHLALRALAHA